jgi:hypothetical protein
MTTLIPPNAESFLDGDPSFADNHADAKDAAIGDHANRHVGNSRWNVLDCFPEIKTAVAKSIRHSPDLAADRQIRIFRFYRQLRLQLSQGNTR